MLARSPLALALLLAGSATSQADTRTEISVGPTVPYDSRNWNTGVTASLTQRFSTKYIDVLLAVDWAHWDTEKSYSYHRAGLQVGLGAHRLFGALRASVAVTAGPDRAWGTGEYTSLMAGGIVVSESTSNVGIVVTPSARIARRFGRLDLGATIAFVISEHTFGSGSDEGRLFPYSSASLATMLTAGATY